MKTDKLNVPFKFKTKPYDHQLKEFNSSKDREYYAFFWEMGTGKTKPLIDTAAHLFLTGEIDGVLVISDKGSYMNWAYNEIPVHMQEDIPRRVRIWKSVMRKREADQCNEILHAKDDMLDVACINVEALSSDRGYKWACEFLDSHYAMIIVDEATSIKNPKATRTKAAWALAAKSSYRRIATGTPVTQGPLDLFGMCQFLKNGSLGHHSFISFRSRYAIMKEIRLGTRRFQTIGGYINLGELENKIKNFSSRLTKDECLDLPDKIYETLYVDMSEAQLKLYRDLKDQAVAMIDEGLLTSTSAITTIEKLHQICCGHVKDDEGVVREIENNRIDILLDTLEKLPNKVIIWAHYQRDVEVIEAAVRNHFKDRYPVSYYGKTSPELRLEALHKFMNDPKCGPFIGTPATGGKGLTLVQAHDVIYYSCGYNLEHRLQSEDRAHRIGQKHKVTYIDMITPGTIEEKILKALKTKKDLAHEILDANRLRAILEDF